EMPLLPSQEAEGRPPPAQLSQHPQSALFHRVELHPVDPAAQFAPHEQLSLLMPYPQNLHSSGFLLFCSIVMEIQSLASILMATSLNIADLVLSVECWRRTYRPFDCLQDQRMPGIHRFACCQ